MQRTGVIFFRVVPDKRGGPIRGIYGFPNHGRRAGFAGNVFSFNPGWFNFDWLMGRLVCSLVESVIGCLIGWSIDR